MDDLGFCVGLGTRINLKKSPGPSFKVIYNAASNLKGTDFVFGLRFP